MVSKTEKKNSALVYSRHIDFALKQKFFELSSKKITIANALDLIQLFLHVTQFVSYTANDLLINQVYFDLQPLTTESYKCEQKKKKTKRNRMQ